LSSQSASVSLVPLPTSFGKAAAMGRGRHTGDAVKSRFYRRGGERSSERLAGEIYECRRPYARALPATGGGVARGASPIGRGWREFHGDRSWK